MKRKPRVRSTYTEAKEQELHIMDSAAAYGIEREVVSVREAKDQLSSLLDHVARGKQIVITSDGRPKAMIVDYQPALLGAPWVSRKALRIKTTVAEDSAPILRKERDEKY
jgi:prevent-host-death family protein